MVDPDSEFGKGALRRAVAFAAGMMALAAFGVSQANADEDPPAPGTTLTIFEASTYGEARVVVFQSIVGNTIIDQNVQRHVSVVGSGNNTHGIFQYNVDAGNASNQANVHAIAIIGGGDSSAQSASVYVTRQRGGNTLSVSNSTRSTSIVDSFNNSSGLFAINVNAGNLNNQVNAFAMAFGTHATEKKSIVQISDKALGTIQADSTDVEISGENKRTDTIQDSFKNFSGVLQVNVASGDGNAMSITSTFNVSVRTLR